MRNGAESYESSGLDPAQTQSGQQSKPEGLIIVERDKDTPTAGQLICTIHSLNPETGEERIISNFTYQDTRRIDGCSFAEWAFPLQCRWNFSSDYSKMILTKIFLNSASGQESHAGWIDTNGSFFDVAEALGLQAQDSSSDLTSYGVRFWNDLFEYLEIRSDIGYAYYCVPEDQLTFGAVREGHAFGSGYPYDEYDVTSWIDGTHCIVNVYNRNVIQSLILDTETQTTSNYIPDSFYESWNGVISPDGTQIAFMARLEGGGSADIYITPSGGGEPVKVTGHSFALRNAYYYNGWGGTCTLIDWT